MDITKGEYLNFDNLLLKCGWLVNQERGMARARCWSSRCIAMKGKWLMHNKMEDEINYLWFKSVHNEVFTRCWGSYNEMVSEGTVKASSAKSAPEKQEFDQPNEVEQAATATPRKKPRPSPEATGSNKKTKKGATTLRTIVADAQATKKNAESAMMKARGLLKQIDSNEVYMNAKGKEENEQIGAGASR